MKTILYLLILNQKTAKIMMKFCIKHYQIDFN